MTKHLPAPKSEIGAAEISVVNLEDGRESVKIQTRALARSTVYIWDSIERWMGRVGCRVVKVHSMIFVPISSAMRSKIAEHESLTVSHHYAHKHSIKIYSVL